MTTRQPVVMFGAGCVGRGFLGQLFAESGYAITFVEIDKPLIAAIDAQQGYILHLVDNDWADEITVPVTRVLYSKADEAVVGALAETSLVTTAVGTRSLPDIAPIIAAGIVHRVERGVSKPLNLLICENMPDASATFRKMVLKHVPPGHHAYANTHVGFVDVVIGRTIPRPTAEMRARDCGFIVADTYKKLPVNRPRFVGPPPEIVGLLPTDNFRAYIDRKLYLHNCGHAILGYLGYLRGHKFTHIALADPAIRSVLEAAFAETKAGFEAIHGMERAELDAYTAYLLKNFANHGLADTLVRLARDPVRKLGPKDRLVGAARLAEQAGIVPEALSWGIAAGYRYNYAGDPLAVRLQQRIVEEGLEAVMTDVSGIRPAAPLGTLVRTRYAELLQPDVV